MMIRKSWQQLRAIWMAFWAAWRAARKTTQTMAVTRTIYTPEAPYEPLSTTPPSLGCVIIRAHFFGRWRRCKLGEHHGHFVLAESIEPGDMCSCLIDESNVAPEDVERFKRYNAPH